jgi:hypothetical protein
LIHFDICTELGSHHSKITNTSLTTQSLLVPLLVSVPQATVTMDDFALASYSFIFCGFIFVYSFFVWLLSFNLVILRFIHIAVTISC